MALLANGQNCLEFSSTAIDFQEISRSYISQNHIAKVIEREYLKPNIDEFHMMNVYEYNDSGYVEKIIASDPKLGDNIPIESNFVSKTLFTYELIDSFLYQKELIVRRFNQYGKLNKPDTLPATIKAVHNVFKLNQFKQSGSVSKEYVFDSEGRLESIKSFGNYSNIISLNYDKNYLKQVEYKFTGKDKAAFPNFTVKFKYNVNNLLSESQLNSEDERQNWLFKYLYDPNGRMAKQEIWNKNELFSIHTFEYIYW